MNLDLQLTPEQEAELAAFRAKLIEEDKIFYSSLEARSKHLEDLIAQARLGDQDMDMKTRIIPESEVPLDILNGINKLPEFLEKAMQIAKETEKKEERLNAVIRRSQFKRVK